MDKDYIQTLLRAELLLGAKGTVCVSTAPYVHQNWKMGACQSIFSGCGLSGCALSVIQFSSDAARRLLSSCFTREYCFHTMDEYKHSQYSEGSQTARPEHCCLFVSSAMCSRKVLHRQVATTLACMWSKRSVSLLQAVMLRCALIVACLFIIAVLGGPEDERRPKISDEALERALNDKRYLQRQLKCALGEASCDSVGRRLKSE